MWVIGMEGGLMPAPAKVDRFRLAPGERADVLVDFSALAPGETVELLNAEPAAPQAAQIGARRLPNLIPRDVRPRPHRPGPLHPARRHGAARGSRRARASVGSPQRLAQPAE